MVAPDSVEYLFGYASYVYYILKDYNRAHDLVSQAIELNPSHIEAIALKSFIERRQGKWELSLESLKDMRRLDPRALHIKAQLVNRLITMHRYDEARTEIDKPPNNYSYIEYKQHLLDLREQKDLNQYHESMQDFCEFYVSDRCGWEAFVANRDFESAFRYIAIDEASNNSNSLSMAESVGALTLWVMNDTNSLQQKVPQWSARVNKGLADNSQGLNTGIYLDAAIITGIKGQNEKARDMIDLYFNKLPIDLTEIMMRRHHACKVLGMISEVELAVECLNKAFEQPSRASRFLEPYMPFYDSIRSSTAFKKLLSNVD